MANDEFKKSTANLRKAVPLMMKNHVAATPANYALWYTYVDNAIPQLTVEMDNVLDKLGICPPATNKMLYNNYVATKAETSISDLRSNIEVLVHEVSSTMSDTLDDTSAFSTMIDKKIDQLEAAHNGNMSIEDVMGLVRDLVTESREIRHSTRFLNSQLNTASGEIRRLKEQLAEVQQDALFDSLSSLYNRRAFDEDLETLCAANQNLSLILLDIDHFKGFNDTYGHLFGDTIIKSLARRLQLSCREGITAYRYGGEEFAVIVPNKSLRITRQFAETLRRAIEKLSIKNKRTGDPVGNITASFGVAELEAGESALSLVDRADQQLYEAKHLGRNRVMPV
ncbi:MULTISPECIES: GGDEF domain-containing protein [Vibrio]|uniref:diguanylate cyclase n=1 Tax=Vibrio proteolyticus NBRC 13287 TaxID=1219065 RepID=U3A162_VIBPR|nr:MULTISPECIES: GGDEF domain-containing protein [Vibrio]NAW58789.1 diguanylate cyclase [Vibrio sp. V36_P2S2PM302]NAX19697.1 diguanylate cyclase [Vibrio sp. V39_P1S14PM300]NAX25422.1 diguanylate cyclase [Vibrio sp. V38_P2S17PM301]NAX32175.1 diguanylate cyclase [Vibrio sp. V37_P2S8PM304]GAD67092.1 hypothetical protein VPR01S_06_01090 [Vibrio proteolyticus NBRC 13287]